MWQSRLDQRPGGFDDLVERACGVEAVDPLRLFLGEATEAGDDALVKGEGLAADAVLGIRVGAGESLDGVDIEQDGEVGLEAAGGVVIELVEEVAIEAAAVALVGDGGIGVAVAEDDGAAIEGGTDEAVDVVGAVCEEEEGFGPGGDGVWPGAGLGKEVGAEGDAHGGATRLEGGDGVDASYAESVGEGGAES